MNINTSQKVVIISTLMIIIVLFMYPPWYIIRVGELGFWNVSKDFWGYFFRYDPPNLPTIKEYNKAKNEKYDEIINDIIEIGIDSTILCIEYITIIIIGSMVIYKLKSKAKSL